MYKIVENPRRMTREEIREEFKGKWVFIVDLDGPLYGWYETGVVAVVADSPFEGRETGIYKEIGSKYPKVSDMTLFETEMVFGFREVMPDEV